MNFFINTEYVIHFHPLGTSRINDKYDVICFIHILYYAFFIGQYYSYR